MNSENEYVIPLKIKLVKWIAMKCGAEDTSISVLTPAQWESGYEGKYLLYLAFHEKTQPKLKLVTVVSKPSKED